MIREDTIEFSFEHSKLRQRQLFFLVRVPGFDPDRSGWIDVEVRVQRGMRWWTLEELRHTDVTVYPTDLAGLIESAAS